MINSVTYQDTGQPNTRGLWQRHYDLKTEHIFCVKEGEDYELLVSTGIKCSKNML